MLIDIIDDMEALQRHKENWNAVYQADPESNFFLSWIWMASWLESISETWYVLAAKPDSQSTSYVAYFPIQLWSEPVDKARFINTIRMGGERFSGYHGLICEPAHEDKAIPAIAEKLLTFNWAQLHLDRFLAPPDRLKLFTDVFSGPRFDHRIYRTPSEKDDVDMFTYPYIELPDDWETYLMSHMGTKTRRNARSALRSLDSGDRYVTHATKDSIERDIDTILGFWEKRWGAEKTEHELQHHVSNFRSMMRVCFEDGTLFLPILWKGDEPLAGLARLIDTKKKTLLALMAGRGSSTERPPPGFLLNLYSIRWAIENGFKTYNMQFGNYSYKHDFGPQVRRLDPYRIHTTTDENLGGHLDPRSLPVVFAMAAKFAASGDIEIAATGCRQILDVDPDHQGAGDLLAQIETNMPAANRIDDAKQLARRGESEEAAAILRAVLEHEPKNFDARLMLGLTYLQRRDFAKAEKQIRQAIALSGRVAQAHYNHGLALTGLKHWPKALKSFKKAVALKPDYAQAHNGSGEVLAAMGRKAEAIRSFDKALELQPGFAQARRNREKLAGVMTRRR